MSQRVPDGAGPRREVPAAPRSPAAGGLPEGLQTVMEAMSGFSLADVVVHRNSAEPARLGAAAFTKGEQIHLAPGQERHLPHEAWHVVQQKQGRVRPTLQLGSAVAVNDDREFEREADIMGARSLAARDGGSAPVSSAARAAAPIGGPVVQRLWLENDGTFVWDVLVDGLAWFADKKGKMWFQIPIENLVKSNLPLRRKLAGQAKPLNEWKKFGEVVPMPGSAPSALSTVSSKPDARLSSPSASPQPPMSIAPKDAPSLPSSAPSVTWASFKKAYTISGASKFLQQLAPTRTITPKGKWPSEGKIGYVANILTIPGKPVQNIISAYEGANSELSHGSFAMVIGVNRYRSLDGKTAAKVLVAADTATEAKFPCAIIPFLWDFDWGRPFNEVQATYRQMSEKDQAEALAEEKKNLVQSVIPYGQLREMVTAARATEDFVASLAKTHQHVYIHLGDDDAVMLPKGLFDLYTATIGPKADPSPLVVGGYRFATARRGGDLKSDVPADELTEVASEIDTLFRSLLTTINTELAYPTEPNLAFLAASKNVHFRDLLTPAKQQEKQQAAKKLAALASEQASFEKGAEPYYSTGLLYGYKANEGARLRERLKEVRKLDASATKFTLYDPRLAITTTSARFTLRDEDRVQHEASAARYGAKREAAYEQKDEKAFRMQIMADLLSIKQSHIGGLGKEIDTTGDKEDRKDRQAIASDVFNAAVALLSGLPAQKPPQSKRSARYIDLLKHERFKELAKQAQAIAEKMWKAMDKPKEIKDQSSETDKGSKPVSPISSASQSVTPRQDQSAVSAKQSQSDAPSSPSAPSRSSQIEALIARGLAELEKVRASWQKVSKSDKDPTGYSDRIEAVRSILMAPAQVPVEMLERSVKDTVAAQARACGL